MRELEENISMEQQALAEIEAEIRAAAAASGDGGGSSYVPDVSGASKPSYGGGWVWPSDTTMLTDTFGYQDWRGGATTVLIRRKLWQSDLCGGQRNRMDCGIQQQRRKLGSYRSWRRCAQRVHACIGTVCQLRTVCQRGPVDRGSRKYRMVHRSSSSLWCDGRLFRRI